MAKHLCEPCDHRWWEHRHPDPAMRFAGLALMAVGAGNIVLGAFAVLHK